MTQPSFVSTTAASSEDTAAIAAQFRYFADHRAGDYAPLYARLGHALADDPAALELARRIRTGQSRPDLLLAVIHELVLSEPDHPAAAFYPSVTATPAPGDPAPAVLDLVRSHHDLIAERLMVRLVQTNEVGRCSYLAPAIRHAARLEGDMPIALFEIGASAGLNLLLDKIDYRYRSTTISTSVPASTSSTDLPGREERLVVHADLRGPHRPPTHPVSVAWRGGIDLNPLDLRNAADRGWLRALVWPDIQTRRDRLERALAIAANTHDSIRIHRHDATEPWIHLLADVAPRAHLVVFHTAVLAHMTEAAREAAAARVLQASELRPLSWIQAEPRADGDRKRLRLLRCRDGRVEVEYPLGSYHPHGAWLEWSPTN